jgi:nucleoside-diphosphate-sugar epimerase
MSPVATPRTKDPHADVKIEAERLALDFHQRHGVEVTILRPGLVYGVGEKNIPRLLDAIRRGKFRYLGSRKNIVPMVHLDDVVAALLLAAEKPAANGRVYHITDGSRTTIGELVDCLSELSQLPRPEKVLPLAVPKLACVVFETLQRLKLRNKPGPINRVGLRFLGTSRSIDISRARRELGYEPQVSFREGMAAVVRAIAEKNHDTPHAVSSAAG